jgi:pyruvate carboxylase
MGAHILAIKDMAGLCRPYAAHALVKALKEEIGIPVHFHTHDTSGINAASVLKAAMRAWMSWISPSPRCRLDQPAESELHRRRAAKHAARHRLDLERSTSFPITGSRCAILRALRHAPRTGSAEVYLHEMPGGQFTNLKEQAASMGSGTAGRKSRAATPR